MIALKVIHARFYPVIKTNDNNTLNVITVVEVEKTRTD